MSTITEEQQQVIDRIAEQAAKLDETFGRYTLADAIRRGSQHTKQATGWGTGEEACALHAAALDAVALGYIQQ